MPIKILETATKNFSLLIISVLFGITLLPSCNTNESGDHDPDIETPHVGINPAVTLQYAIISQYPHDTSAYTQGLELYKGKMYEGTGDFENSSIRITDYKTGAVQKKHVMGTPEIFGEGITIFKDKIYQLTWQSHKVYKYDIGNIEKPVNTFDWPYEGWGLTHDTASLIISDGSSNIYFVDPETFKIKSTISVRDEGGPVNMLNELEYVNGFIFANVYQTQMIVKIDAESGHVVGKLYMKNLLQLQDITERTDVLNGIAYDSTRNIFLITGKRWPKLFEMRLAP
jgi:glutamine cyclotransferase